MICIHPNINDLLTLLKETKLIEFTVFMLTHFINQSCTYTELMKDKASTLLVSFTVFDNPVISEVLCATKFGVLKIVGALLSSN